MIDDGVAALLDVQHGMVSLAQLRALGVTRAQRRWQLSRGWRYVLPSVMATRPGPLDDFQQLVTAVLHGGPGSMISSLTAARWHGVTAAVERQLLTVSALRHALQAGPSPGAAKARAALAAAEAGAWSVPEADLADLVSGNSMLPPMWANPRLEAPGGQRLATPDGWFDHVALAIQVHSRRYHSSMTAWDTTVTRDGIFAEHGTPVLAVTPTAIRDQPTETVRRIERAHAQAAAVDHRTDPAPGPARLPCRPAPRSPSRPAQEYLTVAAPDGELLRVSGVLPGRKAANITIASLRAIGGTGTAVHRS